MCSIHTSIIYVTRQTHQINTRFLHHCATFKFIIMYRYTKTKHKYQVQGTGTRVVEVCQNIFIFGKYLFCRGHLQTIFLPLIISLSYTYRTGTWCPACTHSVYLPWCYLYTCTTFCHMFPHGERTSRSCLILFTIS